MNKAMNKDWRRKAIPQFLKMIYALKTSAFKPLAFLSKTFYQWREEDCTYVAF